MHSSKRKWHEAGAGREFSQHKAGCTKKPDSKDVKEKHQTREPTDGVEVLTMFAHFLWSCRTAASNSITIGACWRRLIDGGVLDLRS